MTAPGIATARECAECGTELAVRALACPNCRAFLEAPRLRLVAARAEALGEQGKLTEAREAWEEVLTLLPVSTRQHAMVVDRVKALAARAADAHPEIGGAAPVREGPWYKRWAGGIGAVALLILTKGKFLLMGLTKLPTFLSMFGYFGVYWATFGWPLALGLVVGIYIHEMGHVAAILRIGGKPTAPMFIPGLGAFVSYSRTITDPREDAYVGLAGPIWGAAAALAAFGMAKWTGVGTWLAIAQITGWLNLFNLTPFFGLDGSHGFKALARWQRAAVTVALVVAWYLTGVPLILLPAAVAAWRVFQPEQGPGDARAFANFLGLVGVLSWVSALRAL